MNSIVPTHHAQRAARRAKGIHAFFQLLRKALSGNQDLSRAPRRSQTPPPARPAGMSEFSDGPVKNGSWCLQNFVIGAGMVIIQPSTNKIVLIYRSDNRVWFLPRGRKDIGESIEQTALREAYEESGYRVKHLPLLNPSCSGAVGPLEEAEAIVTFEPNTEPIFCSIRSWKAGETEFSSPAFQGEYLTFWYVGQIGPDAVHYQGTGTAVERYYESHLVTYEDAMTKIWGEERKVIEYAWAAYLATSTSQQRNGLADFISLS